MPTSRRSSHVRFWTVVYATLCRAMPAGFRVDHLEEATEDFAAILADAERWQGHSVVLTALMGLFDLARRIPIERWLALRAVWGTGANGGSPAGLAWGERMMNGIREFRRAARSLSRRPGFTVVAVLTLALGIGANAAIYSVVDSVLLQPLPFDESEDLVIVRHHAPGIDLPTLSVSSGLFNFYWESADFFEPLGSFNLGQRNLTGVDQSARIEVLMATPELFDVLRVAPAVGRPFQPADVAEGAAPVVILTDNGWKARFGGDPGILGQSVSLDGVPHEIVGIMASDFRFSDRTPALLTPLPIDPNGAFGAFGTQGLARLATGVTVASAGQRLTDLQSRLTERFPDLTPEFLEQAGWSASVESWRDVIVSDVESTLWIVLGTVGFVLLIACANVANLFLVRAESRQKEMAIRAAMGAGRRSVMGSLLAESVLLGLIGGVVGAGLAWVGLTALVASGPAELPRIEEIGMGVGTLGLVMLMSLVAGAAFGLVSWARYSGGGLAGILRDGGRASTGGRETHRTRNVLVASQLALALVLLVGSGLMMRSFAALNSVDPGFDTEGILAVGLSRGESDDFRASAQFYQQVADEVAALPGVATVGVTTRVPLQSGNSNGGSFGIESRPTPDDELPPVAMYRAIGPGYFEAMGVEVLEGRTAERADVEEGRLVAWVNRTFADTHLDGRAIGERIRWDDGVEYAEIVGVVEDVKEFELTEDIGASAYLPLVIGEWPYPGLASVALVVEAAEGGDPNGFVPAIRDIVTRLDADVPLTSTETIEDILARSMAATSFAMTLLGIATAVALFLGAIGLFGVISYVVGQRTREIGVRVALGAKAGEVSGMVVRQALVVTAVGAGVGLLGAFGLTRMLGTLLYGVSTTDPMTFVTAPVLLVLVSLLASWLPARRAARVDPVTALRAD